MLYWDLGINPLGALWFVRVESAYGVNLIQPLEVHAQIGAPLLDDYTASPSILAALRQPFGCSLAPPRSPPAAVDLNQLIRQTLTNSDGRSQLTG